MLPGMSGAISGQIKPPIDITPFTSFQSAAIASSYTYTGISVPANDFTSILLVFTTSRAAITNMTWNSLTGTKLVEDQVSGDTDFGGCWYFVVPSHGSTISSNIVATVGGTISLIGMMAYLIENVSFTTPRDFRDFTTTPFGDWVNVPGGSAVLAYIADYFPSPGADTHTWTGVNEDIDRSVRATTGLSAYHSSGSIVTGPPDSSYDVAVVCSRVPTDFIMLIIGWR